MSSLGTNVEIKCCGRFFSTRLALEDINSEKRELSDLALSVSYGPNQGFELAVPVLEIHMKYDFDIA